MAEQMTWLTPQAVNEALTPAPLTNNVLAGKEQAQKTGYINALSGLDVNDPDYLNKYATAAVKAGMDNTLTAIGELKQKNFERQVGVNALSGLNKGPQYLAGTQSPTIGGQDPNQAQSALTQAAPTQSAPQAPDPHAVAGLHSDIADAATALLQIPPGPARTQAAQQLADHFVQTHELDPQGAAAVVQKVNTPGYLESQIQGHHQAAAQALGTPSQSPAVVGQAPTDTGSANPAGTVAPTPSSPNDATYAAARATLSNPAAEDRAVLKAYTPIDLSEEAQNARTLLAPQLAGEATAQTAAATPFEATYGTMAGPELKGQKKQFASRAEFNADQAAHPGYWETPSANQLSGTVELTRADNGAKVTFPNKAAAEAAAAASPGVYGEPSISGKALQGAAATPYSTPNAVTGGSDVTLGPPQGSGATTGLQPNAAEADAAIRSAIPGAVLTSGFRTAAQNAAVNGVSDSAHKAGEGLDYHIPPTITPQNMVKQIKTMYPNAAVMYEGPGAPNSTGPHVHVAFPAPPAGATTPGATFGNQVGGTPGQERATDMKLYTDNVQTPFSNPNFAPDAQVKVNIGNMVKGLAGSTLGPGTPQWQQITNWAATAHIPGAEKAASDVNELSKVLATASRDALTGVTNVRNEKEYNTLVSSVGNITDPKESLVYSGAAIAAAGQYKQAQQAAFNAYSNIPGHDPTQTAFNAYFASTPAGQKGIFGMPAWNGVDVNGKPLIDHKVFNGKKYMVVGAGLGKGNAQIVPEE